MAEVYVASAPGLDGRDELFAIKLVLPHLKDDPGFATMFLREAAIASRLDHPNIAKIIDYGFERESGDHFLAMEYVQGESLRSLLRTSSRVGGLSWGAALTVLCKVGEALDHAHNVVDDKGQPLGLVHRDVSPSNVLIRYDGIIKLVDFGIAKATNRTQTTVAGSLKGKMGYMAPEQCRCEKVDRRADVFGLGILMYETALGRRLFVAKNEYGAIGKILRGEFKRPSEVVSGFPPDLERIILRCLASDPDQRFPTARDVVSELEQFARSHGIALGQHEVTAAMSALFPPHARAQIDGVGVDRTTRMVVTDSPSEWDEPAPSELPTDRSRAEPVTRPGADDPGPPAVRQAGILGAAMASAFWMACFGVYSVYSELHTEPAATAPALGELSHMVEPPREHQGCDDKTIIAARPAEVAKPNAEPAEPSTSMADAHSDADESDGPDEPEAVDASDGSDGRPDGALDDDASADEVDAAEDAPRPKRRAHRRRRPDPSPADELRPMK